MRSKATEIDAGGPADVPAAGLGSQVGQRQAGDCLIAEWVEPLGGQLQIAGDRHGAIEGAQAVEPLSRSPAVPSGARLVHERLEERLASLDPRLAFLGLGLADLGQGMADRVALIAERPGRNG